MSPTEGIYSMHRKDEEGNHVFEGLRSLLGSDVIEVHVFEKDNYERHEFRHRITDVVALEEIDRTIFSPDLITSGLTPKSKRNYYRVMSYRNGRRGERSLMLWRVHSYKKGGRNYIVATAFEGVSSVANAVHYLEEEVWKKPGSLI